MSGRVQRRLHELLEPRSDDPPIDKVFNALVVALIVANVVAVALETVYDVFIAYSQWFVLFEIASVSFFSIEYVLRLWTCPLDPRYARRGWGRLRYMVSPLALLDLVAILPFYLAFFGVGIDLRFVRVIRVLRVFVLFKLIRYSTALKTLGAVLSRQRGELGVTMVMGGILLVLASGTMYHLEHEAQPKSFSSIPAAMWWGVITLATVGYGDVYPVTPLGRLIGALIAVVGVGLFALPAGVIATGFAQEIQRRSEDRHCPHCGKDMDAPPDHPSTDVAAA